MLGAPTLKCRYLGGHPRRSAAADGKLSVSAERLRFSGIAGFSVSVADITAVRVESAGQIDRRVTFSRAALIGVFALALKKRSDTAANYLTVEYGNGPGSHALLFEADTLPSVREGRYLKRTIRSDARRFAAYLQGRAATSATRRGVARTAIGGLGRAAEQVTRPSGDAARPAAATSNDRHPCPECGGQIKKSAKLCRYCGARFSSR